MKNWKAAFGEAPAWLVVLAFCFVSALAGFVAAVSLAYYGILASAAPLLASALGSLIGATVAVTGSLYVARQGERRAQLVAVDEALHPVNTFMEYPMGMHNLVNRRLTPHWRPGEHQLTLDWQLGQLHELFDAIRPVPSSSGNGRKLSSDQNGLGAKAECVH